MFLIDKASGEGCITEQTKTVEQIITARTPDCQDWIAAVLRRAAAIVMKQDVCQHTFTTRGRICTAAAVIQAVHGATTFDEYQRLSNSPYVSPYVWPVLKRLASFLTKGRDSEPSLVCDWNNVPGRTKEQVSEALLRCAAAIE